MKQPDLFAPAEMPFSLATEIGIDGAREQARLDREQREAANEKAQRQFFAE